jgi:hypothetical protein
MDVNSNMLSTGRTPAFNTIKEDYSVSVVRRNFPTSCPNRIFLLPTMERTEVIIVENGQALE